MAATADTYRRLAAIVTGRVEAVKEDQWGDPTPCTEWDVRQLVGHLVETELQFLGLANLPAGDVPSVDDDPVAAWAAVRDQVQRHLDDPATAGAEYEGLFGTTTFEATVGRFGCFDLVVHGWDLARATGQDERIDPEDVAWVAEQVEGLGDNIRRAGVCGPAVPLPDGADAQSRLLADLGRDPR